jgi:predicted transcriptional regulator
MNRLFLKILQKLDSFAEFLKLHSGLGYSSHKDIKEAKILEENSNIQYRGPPDENIHTEIRNMPQRSDLLIGLDKVMNRSFFSIKGSDTLADALCAMSIQNFQEVIVIDDESKFLGVIKKSEILYRIPPNLLDIPLKFRSRDPDFRKEMGSHILELGKAHIESTFNFDSSSQGFQKNEPLSNALSDLLQSHVLLPKTIPVLNADQTLAGVVTYREILQYLAGDSLLQHTRVSALLAMQYEYVYTLTTDAALSEASMAIDYLPTDYIWVCDNLHLKGVITRTQLAHLEHCHYLEMFSYPLKYFLKTMQIEPLLIDPEQSISDVIQVFLDREADFLLDADKTQQGFRLQGVITPISIIHFLLSSLRSIN